MSKQTDVRRRIVSAQVDPALAWRLERIAAEGERSLSGEIRKALKAHVRQQEEADRLAAVYHHHEEEQ